MKIEKLYFEIQSERILPNQKLSFWLEDLILLEGMDGESTRFYIKSANFFDENGEEFAYWNDNKKIDYMNKLLNNKVTMKGINPYFAIRDLKYLGEKWSWADYIEYFEFDATNARRSENNELLLLQESVEELKKEVQELRDIVDNLE